jgi:hypothetical protein
MQHVAWYVAFQMRYGGITYYEGTLIYGWIEMVLWQSQY